MKKAAYILCILLIASGFLRAQNDPQILFVKGNNAYKEAAYDTALNYYLQADSAGFTSWMLHYNTGNAYFKTGNSARAILHYEKALRLSPGNKDVIHNLKFAEKTTVDDITAMPKFFYENVWNTLLTVFSSSTWFIITSAFFWLFCLGMVLFVTNFNGLKIAGYYLIPAAAVLCALSFTITYAADHRLQADHEAVIMDSTVKVKSEPSSTGKTLFVIHSGLKVLVRTEEAEMVEIQLPDGRVGWIESSQLERI